MGILSKLFNSNAVNKLDSISANLRSSGDSIEHQLPEAVDNAKSSAERLGIVLKKAGDDFADPINRALSHGIEWGLKNLNLKDVGGVGIGAGGLAAVITSWYLSKTLKEIPGAFGKLLGGKAGLVGGVVEGEAMSKLGIMPVYVVNFSEMGPSASGFPGMDGAAKKLPGAFSKFGFGAAKFGSGAVGYLSTLGAAGWASMLMPLIGMPLIGALENDVYMKRRMSEIAREKALNPDVPDSDKYNLFSGPSQEVPTFNMSAPQTQVYVYVDTKKIQNVRTVSKRRGVFHTSAVTDSVGSSDTE
jgi:hypothetical protein